MGSLGRASCVAVLAALVAACGDASPPAPPVEQCDGVGRQASFASAEGRWLLGLASRYPADTALPARADALRASQRARREAAWSAVARTLAPVPLAHPTPLTGATVPRFRTWYDREDTARIFQRLYGQLGAAGRAARARFTDGALDEALGWNVGFVTTQPEWSAARLDGWAATLDTPGALNAVGGAMRVAMSPDAVRHLVSSYPEVLRCIASGAPPAFVDGAPAAQQVAREPMALTRCGASEWGPYFVATGGTLTARVEGAPEGVELRVLEGVAPDAATRCTAAASQGCTVSGPGMFVLRAATSTRAAQGTLSVQYTPPTAQVTACLQGVFPSAAATVALEWRRSDLGIPFPYYDTSAAGLSRRLAPGASATWGDGDGTAEPGADAAYTMRLPSGSTFRLAAMHIRTRELDRWMNITLWWSPNPDDDFGADRPDSVRALGGPWSSYKMCVASEFDELDADPASGFDRDAPTLAASLRAVYAGRGGPSWCSNPYIDAGPGLVRSNCVGCHQHAMTGVRPAVVQNDAARFPANARSQVRNNFPADGFWGLDGGDQLSAMMSEVVEYWRRADP